MNCRKIVIFIKQIILITKKNIKQDLKMKIIKILLISFLVFSCVEKKYKYEIKGKVYFPTSGNNPMHDAIWYTDTISFDGDVAYYFNSDGSEVRIYPPFILIDHSLKK
jgi:hypothetical protein